MVTVTIAIQRAGNSQNGCKERNLKLCLKLYTLHDCSTHYILHYTRHCSNVGTYERSKGRFIANGNVLLHSQFLSREK